MSDHGAVEKVRLYTSDGEYVVSVELPNVEPPPRVLAWGKRYFVLGVVRPSISRRRATPLPEMSRMKGR
jgi:hypothetical protein